MQNGKASTGKAACGKVPKLTGVVIGTFHYPETATAGLLCEPDTRNFCIIACSHTVGWKLIQTTCQGVGNVSLNLFGWRRRLNHVLLLTDVHFLLLDERRTLSLLEPS